MKIVYRDENTLILRPAGMFLAILDVVLCVGLGLFLAISAGLSSHLVCQRLANVQLQCQFRKTLFGLTTHEEWVNGLQSARVEEIQGDYNGRTGDYDISYQIVLSTVDGEKQISESSSGLRQRSLVKRINESIQRSNLSRWNIVYNEAKGLFGGAFFFVFALLDTKASLKNVLTTWTFDRVQGVLIHRRRRLFGVKVAEYPLRDIYKVRVVESRGVKGIIVYCVEIWTRSGTRLPLTVESNADISGMRRAVAAINVFLYPAPDMD